MPQCANQQLGRILRIQRAGEFDQAPKLGVRPDEDQAVARRKGQHGASLRDEVLELRPDGLRVQVAGFVERAVPFR